jgi:thiamine-monophosphate kinase
MAGEFDFIHWIQSQQQASGQVLTPAGDDMAVLTWNASDLLLVAVDQVIDQVHFDSRVHSPRQIGRKVMNRNLSDCAAMACLPAGAVAAVALPQGCGLDYARELYLGMKEAADRFACPIVGGDTGSWPGKLVCSVTILGKSAGTKPILRSTAQIGDFVYVTGPLGGSILGRHMDFLPRIELARELASRHRITAMIDISDGLSRDLGHVCHDSRLGARLDGSAIPVHPDALRLSGKDGRPALEHALHDGEDHELLFTSSEEIHVTGITRIGQTVPGSDLTLLVGGEERELRPGAWEHRL